jgi:hypothetical protein
MSRDNSSPQCDPPPNQTHEDDRRPQVRETTPPTEEALLDALRAFNEGRK